MLKEDIVDDEECLCESANINRYSEIAAIVKIWEKFKCRVDEEDFYAAKFALGNY